MVDFTLIILFYGRPNSPQLQRTCFLIKNTKKNIHSSASNWWKYTKSCFKENVRAFSKNSPTQEKIRISRLKKRRRNPYKKENFKSEIKAIIENVQDELYQLKNKQAKGARLHANMRWKLQDGKCSKTFFKMLERQNLQNQTISELYTDNNKSKYSSYPKYIFKYGKKKHFTSTRQLPKLLLLNFHQNY